MARKVKLQDTGEYGMSDTSYRAPNGKYYSNEKSYTEFAKNKEFRQKCIAKMYDLLGYKETMIIPTYFYKDLKSFEGVGYETLYETMCRKESDIEWALKTKQFTAETAKIMYVMAILKNSVMDVYKELKAKEKSLRGTKSDILYIDEFVGMDIPTTTIIKNSNVNALLGDMDE